MCQVCVCLGARRYAVANANSSYIYILCKMLFYIIHFLQKKFHTFLNVKYFHEKKTFFLMFYIILSTVCHYASQYIQVVQYYNSYLCILCWLHLLLYSYIKGNYACKIHLLFYNANNGNGRSYLRKYNFSIMIMCGLFSIFCG